jgi:hypothetical protein
MIVVSMDMWPHGFEDAKYPLGSARIWNTGGTHSIGEYKFELFDKAGRSYKKGEIKGFPRLKLLAWDLLFRVLKAALGMRNGEAPSVGSDSDFAQAVRKDWELS